MTLYTTLSRFRLLVLLKHRLDQVEFWIFRIRQVIRKRVRRFGVGTDDTLESHTFAICCVKRPAYVQMAVENINSLHFHNPKNKVVVYVDSVCADAYNTLYKKLDYPSQVRLNEFIATDQPWQISKISVLIDASLHNRILTDADGIWRANPKIDSSKVVFLVVAYSFNSNPLEMKMIQSLFSLQRWTTYAHYVTGFVFIPRKFMTPKLARDIRMISKKIIAKKYAFRHSKIQAESLARLAEEIAVSLAVQENIPAKQISTLKRTDGPSDKNILQSLYYGCTYRIVD